MAMVNEDESNLTEITLLPDGRVFVFGMSAPVLEILGEIQPRDERLQRLLAESQNLVGASRPLSENTEAQGNV
jgi:hypothetical protein